MIICDLTQTIISNVIVGLSNELKNGKSETNKDLIKHMTFTTLLSYKKKYGSKFGELVLACDSSETYWRKQKFSFYKGHRKHDRAESDLDWSTIFEAINEVKADLAEYFNYRVLNVPHAEADDVIACLVKYLQSNQLVTDGLFDGEPQQILIISSDTDFVQLQKYKGVTQWSPIQKKFIKASTTVSNFINDHIATGDSGDNIPNVLTSSEWAEDRAQGKKPNRQKSLSKDRLKDFVNKGIDACSSDEERLRWNRNQQLIDFEYIPESIDSSVKDAYINYEFKGSKTKLMGYFVKHKMKNLFAELNSF